MEIEQAWRVRAEGSIRFRRKLVPLYSVSRIQNVTIGSRFSEIIFPAQPLEGKTVFLRILLIMPVFPMGQTNGLNK